MIELKGLGWVAWILTMLSWGVSYRLSKHAAAKNEHNKTVDSFVAAINQCEDDALDYWIRGDSAIHGYQLALRLKRATRLAKSLASDKQPFPSEDILTLRQAATLLIESDPRPINAFSTRAKKIMSSCEKLQQYYSKKL